MKPLLSTHGLGIGIAGRTVCRDLELEILPGQSWALLGRNGAGKTTLLQHLAGLRGGHDGEIRLAGKRLSSWSPRLRAQRIAILLQHSTSGFGASVLETVLTGRHPHLPRLAWEGANDLAIADDCIAAVGLEGFGGRALDTLSGGELRRVEIARLLAQQAGLCLLDEPFNHLDLGHQADILRLLGRACVGATRAMLLVAHDLNLAYAACDHWLLLNGDGSWQAGGRDRIGDPQILSRAFAHPILRIDSEAGPLFRAGL